MDADSLECLIGRTVEKRRKSSDGRNGFYGIESAFSREGWVFMEFGDQFYEGGEAADILMHKSSKECWARERRPTSARDFFQR
jgi:hypothetical protein